MNELTKAEQAAVIRESLGAFDALAALADRDYALALNAPGAPGHSIACSRQCCAKACR